MLPVQQREMDSGLKKKISRESGTSSLQVGISMSCMTTKQFKDGLCWEGQEYFGSEVCPVP